MRAKIHFDGAAKGNPGPAGYGFVIEFENRRVIQGYGYIGETTNNVAEYHGLIEALTCAHRLGAKSIRVFSDSQLVVKQLSGEYRVKADHLKELHARALRLLNHFEEAHIEFVERERNKEADRLANEAIRRLAGGSDGR